jgi:hypothetical protein
VSPDGDAAKAESAKRAEEFAADGDLAGVAVWLRVIDATRQLAITASFGSVHWRDGSSRGRTRVSPDAVRSSVEFLEGQIGGEEPAIIGFGEPEPLL